MVRDKEEAPAVTESLQTQSDLQRLIGRFEGVVERLEHVVGLMLAEPKGVGDEPEP